MAKKIITYNFDEIKDGKRKIDYDDLSLFDADILILAPHLPKNVISAQSTTNLYNNRRKWVSWAEQFSNEFNKLLKTKANILIYMQKQVWVQYSENHKNYNFSSHKILGVLGNALSLTNSEGNEILFQNNPILSCYWQKYSSLSFYETYFEFNLNYLGRIFDSVDFIPCFSTKVPDNYIGGIFKIDNANIILLPTIRRAGVNQDELLEHIIMIDSIIRNEAEKSVKPAWVTNIDFPLPMENEFISQIRKLEEERDLVIKKITEVDEVINDIDRYRDLLYETGKNLEESVINALELIGFIAEEYLDNESQFDVVFTSPEGRFLGEVEGKDNSAINVNKLNQLLRNLAEDDDKDTTTEPAKGVLFGNANRYTKLEERTEFFTEKCIKSAISRNIALIKTPDLFWVSRYLLENPQNEDIKNKCRQAIMQGSGIVNLVDLLPPANKNS